MPLPENSPTPGRRVVFVYYRVAAFHAPALQQAFARVKAGIGGWQPRLMRKVPGVRDREAMARGPSDRLAQALQTWMEVYRPPHETPQANEDLQPVIDGCVRSAGILDLIEGERHYEFFEPCA